MIKGEERKKRKGKEENNIKDKLGEGGKREIKERKLKRVERGRRKKKKNSEERKYP